MISWPSWFQFKEDQYVLGGEDGPSDGAVESDTDGGSKGGNDGSSLGAVESDGGEEEEGLPLTVGDPDGTNLLLMLLLEDLGIKMDAPVATAPPRIAPNMHFLFLFNHDC